MTFHLEAAQYGFTTHAVPPQNQEPAESYPVSQTIKDHLKSMVQSWKFQHVQQPGYPFHMGSYSVLGPAIGTSLGFDVPQDWLQTKAPELVAARMESLGITTPQDRGAFQGAFTDGSTMGNRIGIHAALQHNSGAYVYFSADLRVQGQDSTRCHARRAGLYSLTVLSNERYWIETTVLPEAEYSLVLFANMGTTVVGAHDDSKKVYYELRDVGIQISYIHVDGALPLVFGQGYIALGPPGTLNSDSVPNARGTTLSHYKALGHMVSGEVIYYSPVDTLSLSERHGSTSRSTL
ncbi:hypothetical protein AB5N19_13372 [Seiridium cardinale]